MTYLGVGVEQAEVFAPLRKAARPRRDPRQRSTALQKKLLAKIPGLIWLPLKAGGERAMKRDEREGSILPGAGGEGRQAWLLPRWLHCDEQQKRIIRKI